MGVIYKITNLINGKIYIGQTRVTEPQRWQQHIWYANNAPEKDSVALCRAIKKYGKDNFKREILEEINDNEKLNEREIYYIMKYNSTNKDIGYNIALGGFGKAVYNNTEILELYYKHKTIAEVSRILGCQRETISRRLRAMGIETYNKSVLQYSTAGQFIAGYSSFAEAKRKTGLNLPHIIPKHKYHSGFFWLYEVDNDDIKVVILNYKNERHLTKEIQQYDLNCNYIKSFNSATEASKELNIDVSSIKAAINGKQKTAGGFIWYKPNTNGETLEEKYQKYINSSSCCEIEEIDLFGNVIGTFPSASYLERELHWTYNCIKNVCDGKTTHTHGRLFRYKNEDKRKLKL